MCIQSYTPTCTDSAFFQFGWFSWSWEDEIPSTTRRTERRKTLRRIIWLDRTAWPLYFSTLPMKKAGCTGPAVSLKLAEMRTHNRRWAPFKPMESIGLKGAHRRLCFLISVVEHQWCSTRMMGPLIWKGPSGGCTIGATAGSSSRCLFLRRC